MEVVRDMMAFADDHLPQIRGIIHSPTYYGKGELQIQEGYNFSTGLFYASNGLKIPRISQDPTDAEVEKAAKLLLDEVFVDFPFRDKASKANLIGLCVLPFVREMIPGPTPLHLIDSPEMGTGKSKMAEAVARIALGREPGMIENISSDEECIKKIFADLRQGKPMIVVDNLTGNINFPSLNMMATTTLINGRILGQSKTEEVPNRATWILTGNNVDVDGDISRRVVWIRLDAKSERPFEEKREFKHPKLMTWIQENRGSLVWACLTLIQNWIAKGKPGSRVHLASFEEWADVIGGILESAGIDGFLGNRDEFLARANTTRSEWDIFVEAWACHFDKPVETKHLHKLAQENDLLWEIFADAKSSTAEKQRLGKALTKKLDSVHCGYQISRFQDKHAKVWKWHLKPLRSDEE